MKTAKQDTVRLLTSSTMQNPAQIETMEREYTFAESIPYQNTK
jgi:hypothetical protein